VAGEGECPDSAHQEYTDALGNTHKVKEEKRELSRQEKKQRAKSRKMRKARGEEVSDSEDEY